MKLEVGMYIRTKDGIIDKVIIDYNGHCANPNCKHKHISCAKNYYDEDNVVKASYNIIDLIEVGDFLDNHCIVEIKENTCYLNDGWFISGDDIENLVYSICTHEMFERGSFEI